MKKSLLSKKVSSFFVFYKSKLEKKTISAYTILVFCIYIKYSIASILAIILLDARIS